MESTPITSSAIETLGVYVRALTDYRESLTATDPLSAGHQDKKYTALIRLAASAEECQKTSTLDWHDENGEFVSPGAEGQTSALLDIILTHPDKARLFSEAATGNIVPLDAETEALINDTVERFIDHPEP
jgi:hypothetical protein